MPKNFIKRYLPDQKKIREHKYIKLFGELLHDGNIWHLNRHSVARAFSVGVFCAFLPLPFQMLIAAAMAILARANLPLSVCLVWITNPFTMPAIFYFTYRVGAKILDSPHQNVHIELSWQWLSTQFLHIWEPLVLGSVICGIIFAILANIGIRILWRISVARKFQLRKITRLAKKNSEKKKKPKA